VSNVQTAIIPEKVGFYHLPNVEIQLDNKAICCFAAIGFFLEDDTYFTNQKAFDAASEYVFDDAGNVVSKKLRWAWHYTPKEISLQQTTEQFTDLFHSIVKEKVTGQKVILPTSGGLDSRSLAAALVPFKKDVHSFSYEFENGHAETKYAKAIAQACDFQFSAMTVPKSYLWNKIDRLATINGCYSEFTNPRQMAFIDEYPKMGNMFVLGHWGDVLFDGMGVDEKMNDETIVKVLLKKVVKKGGLELAELLWKNFGFEGSFANYLQERLLKMLSTISIDHAGAKVRAFKSKYWASRWTSVGTATFQSVAATATPYFDDRMCQFICNIPENILANRQVQIEYLKQNAPALAKIMWQEHKPFNLHNYHLDKAPYNLPYRIWNKAIRTAESMTGKKYTMRNWELQFLGNENEAQLKNHLFNNAKLNAWVDPKVVNEMYALFNTNEQVYYSHPVSMLLTLSLFSKHFL
jgi:asparagine synthetase B (glutamine-hydrolysing)